VSDTDILSPRRFKQSIYNCLWETICTFIIVYNDGLLGISTIDPAPAVVYLDALASGALTRLSVSNHAPPPSFTPML